MFCCFNAPSSYAPIETTIGGDSKPANIKGTSGDFPGNRRCASSDTNNKHLVQTGGNALMAYDPETMKDLVNVTLPKGCHPGQVIHVQDPNSITERVAQIVVPPGSRAGSTIMVKLPDEQYFTPENETVKNDGFVTDLTLKEEVVVPNSETPTDNRVVVQSLDVPLSQIPYDQSNQPAKSHSSMLVRVPVGVAPGTIIHVKIPDEDKFVPVTVPEGGISQFYANYSPADTIDMKKNGRNKQQQSKKQNWHDSPIAYGLPMLVLPGII